MSAFYPAGCEYAERLLHTQCWADRQLPVNVRSKSCATGAQETRLRGGLNLKGLLHSDDFDAPGDVAQCFVSRLLGWQVVTLHREY